MAARVGAGTGVIVSLVVFVLATVFLLVLAIVFYRGKLEADEKQASNARATAKFVKADEQSSEWIKAAESAAGPGKSIARYQQEQIQRLMGYLTGNPDENLGIAEEALKQRYGVGPQKSAAAAMDDLRKQLKESVDEGGRLKARLAEQEVQVSKLFEELRRRDEAHRQEIDTATASIAEYRTQAQKLFAEVEELKTFLRQESDRARERYEGQIATLNADLDNALQESAVLRSRIKQFEARLEEIRIKSKDPSMLVDGRVVDVAGVDEVFIDRGREHRIVLGMTFELFDDESAIRPDPVTGAMRGKASLQVTRVNQTTSVARVTRATAVRPIVRGDVIANAIYDPTYRFKFLMHGKFDVDGDGRATDAEAEHLRNLVLQWGGTVVTGEELPGDLDFLVLGEEPPIPPPLRVGASELEQRVYIDRKAAQANYNRLRDQALQAQIPVLNANRFLILIGHTAR